MSVRLIVVALLAAAVTTASAESSSSTKVVKTRVCADSKSDCNCTGPFKEYSTTCPQTPDEKGIYWVADACTDETPAYVLKGYKEKGCPPQTVTYAKCKAHTYHQAKCATKERAGATVKLLTGCTSADQCTEGASGCTAASFTTTDTCVPVGKKYYKLVTELTAACPTAAEPEKEPPVEGSPAEPGSGAGAGAGSPGSPGAGEGAGGQPGAGAPGAPGAPGAAEGGPDTEGADDDSKEETPDGAPGSPNSPGDQAGSPGTPGSSGEQPQPGVPGKEEPAGSPGAGKSEDDSDVPPVGGPGAAGPGSGAGGPGAAPNPGAEEREEENPDAPPSVEESDEEDSVSAPENGGSARRAAVAQVTAETVITFMEYTMPNCEGTGIKIKVPKTCSGRYEKVSCNNGKGVVFGICSDSDCTKDCTDGLTVPLQTYTKATIEDDKQGTPKYLYADACTAGAASYTFQLYDDVRTFRKGCNGKGTDAQCVEAAKGGSGEQADQPAGDEKGKGEKDTSSTEGSSTGSSSDDDKSPENSDSTTTNNSSDGDFDGITAPAHSVGVLALVLCLLACAY